MLSTFSVTNRDFICVSRYRVQDYYRKLFVFPIVKCKVITNYNFLQVKVNINLILTDPATGDFACNKLVGQVQDRPMDKIT